jgi:hypothetical protein
MNFKEWLLNEKIMIKDQEFREPLIALQYIRKNHPFPNTLAVTFTKIDKIGLNPQSKWKTPLGIYLYPLDYVIEKKMNVPFAANEPHINVCEFTRPQKILHMNPDVSKQDGMELLNVFPKEQVDQASKNIDKSVDMFSKAQKLFDHKKTKLNNLQYDQEKENDLYKKYIDAKTLYDFTKDELQGLAPHIGSNYSKLWLVTRILANNKPTQWNINLRKCGIDGFVDHGTGTIHPSEPTQCVVFATNNLKLLHSIDNPKYFKKTDNYNSKKMSDEQIIGLLQSRRSLDLTNLFLNTTEKNKMADLIIKHKTYISHADVEDLIYHAQDKDKMAKMIIQKNPEFTDSNVSNMISLVNGKDKIIELIIDYKPKLTDNNVEDFLKNATEKDKIANLLIERLPEMTYKNMINILTYAIDKDKIAKRLGEDNISRLNWFSITLLHEKVPEKDKPKIIQIIEKYHKNKNEKIKEFLDHEKEMDKHLNQTIAAK